MRLAHPDDDDDDDDDDDEDDEGDDDDDDDDSDDLTGPVHCGWSACKANLPTKLLHGTSFSCVKIEKSLQSAPAIPKQQPQVYKYLLVSTLSTYPNHTQSTNACKIWGICTCTQMWQLTQSPEKRHEKD